MDPTERYSRQILFLGSEGQERLRASSVVIVGCGALGAIQAETLARAGVGRLTLVDRDFVEPSNLHRQIMFEESDALDRIPKAVAAARRVQRINSDVEARPVIADVNYENVEELVGGTGLILDGTDNFETRFLLNDASVKLGIPWIYGGAVGSYGLTMTVLPGKTPCLRCVLETIPDAAAGATCETAGVLLPIVSVIGSIQSAEALKLLSGNRDKLHGRLIRVDVWDLQFTSIDLPRFGDRPDCPACAEHRFEFLGGARRQIATRLCGRNSVQITGSPSGSVDFAALAGRLERLGTVDYNEFLLRFRAEGYDITIFRDARSIIKGTSDEVLARSLYSRYIGS